MNQEHSTLSAALTLKRKEKMYCPLCKMNNHNIETCFQINGFPDNNKNHAGESQGYYRGGLNARLGAIRGRGGYRGGRNYGGRGYAHQA